MTVFDLSPIAAASLDMTTALAPLLYGLFSLLGLSAVGIVLTAVLPWMQQEREGTAVVASAPPHLSHGAGAPAVSR